MISRRLAAAALLGLTLAVAGQSAADPATSVQQARSLMQSGRLAEAEPALRAALAASPGDPALSDLMGSLLNQLGRYAEALPHAQVAAGAQPQNVMYRYNRGLVLAEVGRFEAAVADFDFALSQRPGLAYAYLERGAARASLGDMAAARADFARARAAEPGLIWCDWYEATADFVEGRFDSAAERFAKVATDRPAFAPARLWRVLALARAGRSATPAASVDPTWPAPAMAYMAGTLDAEALIAAARRDGLSGDERRLGEAYFVIAQRQLSAGRPAAARLWLERAVAVRAPRHAWKLAAERDLRRAAAAG